MEPHGPARALTLSPPDPHPFVKWAGGKSGLVAAIAARLPSVTRVRRYVEPFVGAGALFYWIRRSFPAIPCVIGDSNEELINAYRAVRRAPEAVIAKLETHALLHSKDHFYRVRKSRPTGDVERAARFIYLNRTCFNGLYRVNRSGEFNVPMGRYRNPRILDRENLLAVSAVLRGVAVRHGDFEAIVEDCGPGDLLYLDPPYQPISPTSHFTSYTREGFGEVEQRRLAATFERLARRGAHVILSNSDTGLVRELYESLDPRPRIDEVEVPRAISATAKGRGRIREVLVYTQARGGAV